MRNTSSLKKAGPSAVIELVVVAFMGTVALAASLTGFAVILFPELAALSHDVLVRPKGKWASQPVQLILAPTLTAAFGLFCTRHLQYAVWNVVLIVAVSIVVIKLLRCGIAPAISAGVLPLVLGERSWYYPLAIFLDISVLVLILTIRKRFAAAASEPLVDVHEAEVVDELEEEAGSRYWWVALFGLVIVVGSAAQYTGLRFLLFPPLIVMSYELFGHAGVHGWMKRPALLPLACVMAATIGVILQHLIHPAFLAVGLTALCCVGVLRMFTLHMPPALAVGIIPFVLERPDYRYPLSVFAGTVALTLIYLGYQRLQAHPEPVVG